MGLDGVQLCRKVALQDQDRTVLLKPFKQHLVTRIRDMIFVIVRAHSITTVESSE